MAYEAPSKYKGTGNYGDLMASEQAHYSEYTNLRGISDWPGFDSAQDERRADSKEWLNRKMDEIVEAAKNDGGWDKNDRGKRYDYLSTQNSGSPKHEVRLPCPGSATDSERVYIEEREVYLVFQSTTDEQKARKQANVDILVAKRKQLWHLMQDDPENNKLNDRQARYDALCIATHHGEVYEEWDKTHNKYGQPYSEEDDSKSTRSKIKDWLDSYIGVHENPDGSNKGNPQPSQWQVRVYGDDGVPWCACFAVCSAWDNGVTGSGTAGVYNNVQLAKQGKGIYKGWTNDPSKVHAGDHAFIGSDHTGVIYDRETGATVEGNTSNSGSQWNGGSVVKKNRGWGYWSAGFGIIRAD